MNTTVYDVLVAVPANHPDIKRINAALFGWGGCFTHGPARVGIVDGEEWVMRNYRFDFYPAALLMETRVCKSIGELADEIMIEIKATKVWKPTK